MEKENKESANSAPWTKALLRPCIPIGSWEQTLAADQETLA